jgi:membrane protease YdiL (CAAX protease family)
LRRSSLTQLVAVAIAILPLAALLLWMRLTRDTPFEAKDLFVYPIVFGGGAIVLIVALLYGLCRQGLADLNLATGRWWGDVLWGLGLFAVFVLMTVLQQVTVARWFPTQPAPEINNLIEGISHRPLLLALWLGPVVWIGVAGFEELLRVFVLSRLWLVWPARSARWGAVLATAGLFGAAHAYQGVAGIISTGLMGLVAGGFYLAGGRVWPLVISHALYDSAWIVFGVIMITRASG